MSKKSKQPMFAIISVILTVVAFGLFILANFMDPTSIYGTYMLVGGLSLLVASFGLYFFVGKSGKAPAETPENVITVIACKNCDFKEERAFLPGDYIFKEMGPCKKCQGASYIKAIYSVTPKKE
ncbi:MAG: hypothetical protein LUP94_02705, partial [Candidatus Methanomethylicus sp.]|nr:hypothetical protein [Candidatus Methanomethylicus sp.]